MFISKFEQPFLPGIFKLHLEMYLDMLLAVFLMTDAFVELRIDPFINARDDIICTSLTIVSAVILLLLPIIIYKIL